MDKVYFLKDKSKIKEVLLKLLGSYYSKGDSLAVKLHFGEPGNNMTFTPEDIKPITEVLHFLELKPFLIDTPVVYPSIRNTVEGYKKIAEEKGYGKLAPIVISNDGLEVEMKDFTSGVCRELVEADSVLVISHVKGHMCSGFGGAIKNLGMGGVTKETKKIEHELGRPRFKAECKGCGICSQICPVGAIEMKDGKAEVNLENCAGCSLCILHCPSECMVPESALFDDLLAQGAASVINNLPARVFYINFVSNIVRNCDCAKDPGDRLTEDVGILFSENPVAIDKASLDLVNKTAQREVFREVHKRDPVLHLQYAFEYTKKSLDYELIIY